MPITVPLTAPPTPETPASISIPAGTTPVTTPREDGDEIPVFMSNILIPAIVSSIVIVLCILALVAICIVSVKARTRITRVCKPCFTQLGKSHDNDERGIGGQDSTHSPSSPLYDNDAYERSTSNMLNTQQQAEMQAQQKRYEDFLQHPVNYKEIDSDGTASHYERVSGMDTDRNRSGLDRVRKGTVMQRNPTYRQRPNNNYSSVVSDLLPTGNKVAFITKDSRIQSHESKEFEGAYSRMSENYENCTLKSRSDAYDNIGYKHVIEMTNNVAYGQSSPTELVLYNNLC